MNKTKNNEATYKPALELLGDFLLGPFGLQLEVDSLTKEQLYLLCFLLLIPSAQHWGFIALRRFVQLIRRVRR